MFALLAILLSGTAHASERCTIQLPNHLEADVSGQITETIGVTWNWGFAASPVVHAFVGSPAAASASTNATSPFSFPPYTVSVQLPGHAVPSTDYPIEIRVSDWGPNGFTYLCSKTITVSRSTDYCPAPAWWHDMSDVPAPFSDTANCVVEPIPAGADPFVYDNNWYVEAEDHPGTSCPDGGYDGANCYLQPKPANGYISGNGFYVFKNLWEACPSGSAWISPHACLVRVAAPGTQPFEYAGNWYTTPEPACSIGWYDGNACYVGSAPGGSQAFLHGGLFYYGW
jgi:hypothetical protein